MEYYRLTPREYTRLMEESFKLGRQVALEKSNTSHKRKLIAKSYEIISNPFGFLNKTK